MSKHEKADQARKGLVDSVKGKAKELFGAVTGNDSLDCRGAARSDSGPGAQRGQQCRGGRRCRGRAAGAGCDRSNGGARRGASGAGGLRPSSILS